MHVILWIALIREDLQGQDGTSWDVNNQMKGFLLSLECGELGHLRLKQFTLRLGLHVAAQ